MVDHVAPELDSQKVIQALKYLQREGFTGLMLQDLHHTRRDNSFEACMNWRLKHPGPNYGGGNPNFHKRLLYVAAEHWRTGRGWKDLSKEAWDSFPK